MRYKEEANDYRYFEEPDLVPVAPTDAMRKMVHESMPELPNAQRERIVNEWKINDSDAQTLVSNVEMFDLVEGAILVSDASIAKDATNMAIIELAAILNESDSGFDALKITSQNLADICTMISDGDVSRNQAKTLLAELANHGGEAKSLADKMGLKQVSDTSALEAIIDSVFEEFAQDVASYSDADEGKQKKLQGFLMGKAMAASKGQGNPQLFNQIISKKLG